MIPAQDKILLRVLFLHLFLILIIICKKFLALLLTFIPFSVFRDLNTPDPFLETFLKDDGQAARDSKPNHVYMDNVFFGLGMCCTQVCA